MSTPFTTPSEMASGGSSAPAAVPPPVSRTMTRLTIAAEAVASEDDHLVRLMREDPENPLLCPRHARIERGGLGPTMNSSGQWGGFYGCLGSGCRLCKQDDEENELVKEMCYALARAEKEPTRYNLGALRMAIEFFDEFAGPYGGRYEREIIQKALPGLEKALVEAESTHYCGDSQCKWDCGELRCGCIDMCRGRCGMHMDRNERHERR